MCGRNLRSIAVVMGKGYHLMARWATLRTNSVTFRQLGNKGTPTALDVISLLSPTLPITGRPATQGDPGEVPGEVQVRSSALRHRPDGERTRSMVRSTLKNQCDCFNTG